MLIPQISHCAIYIIYAISLLRYLALMRYIFALFPLRKYSQSYAFKVRLDMCP